MKGGEEGSKVRERRGNGGSEGRKEVRLQSSREWVRKIQNAIEEEGREQRK